MAALQRMFVRGTPRATKQAARYTPAGGAERCGMCRHYAAPSSCARIEGPVSAAGWCALFSQQVTWRPRAGQGAGLPVPPASLDLSFMTPGALPSGVTFTRASTGSYFDATGTLQTAAANAPRWDYDPNALSLNGLLIEEARTNLALNSGDPSNASWTKAGAIAVAPTVTGNQVTAPNGTLSAARVVYPGVGTASSVSVLGTGLITMTANPYSFSVWLRGNAGGERLYIYVSFGTSIYYRQQVTLGTTWQRYSVSTPNLTAASWNCNIGTDLRDAGQSATSAQTIYVWGAQVEQGAFSTSYIPTTAASATRAAEGASIPTSAWFNASESSLAADFMVAQSPNPSATLVRDACALSDASANNRLMLRAQIVSAGTAAFGTSIAGTTTASASLGATTAGAIAKVGAAWNGATGVGALNGGSAVSYAVGMPATLTTLTMGNDYSGAAAYLNGWLRRVRYWSRALSAAELQSVTT